MLGDDARGSASVWPPTQVGALLWRHILHMVYYANLCKFIQNQWKMLLLCHFLADFYSVLSDRAWCRLQNFYTEFWNSLIMQMYANVFKINEKCYFSVISRPILILFGLSDRAWWGLQNLYTEFWHSLIMQIYAYLFKSNKKCYSISQRILILFVLSDRAWWGLQNLHRIVKFINYANLCKFIQNQWKMPPLLYSEITTDLHLRRGRILRIA